MSRVCQEGKLVGTSDNGAWALPASHLLLGILCKCWQTGFAGPTAVVGRGSCLLQLAPVRVEKPHSFGAPHVVPARVSETGKSEQSRACGPPTAWEQPGSPAVFQSVHVPRS